MCFGRRCGCCKEGYILSVWNLKNSVPWCIILFKCMLSCKKSLQIGVILTCRSGLHVTFSCSMVLHELGNNGCGTTVLKLS
jgi:hypothetical protein